MIALGVDRVGLVDAGAASSFPHFSAPLPLTVEPPFGSGDDHINRSASAPRTHKPVAPIEHGSGRAVSSRHFHSVGLDLMATPLAPYNEPHPSGSGVAERHRRSGL